MNAPKILLKILVKEAVNYIWNIDALIKKKYWKLNLNFPAKALTSNWSFSKYIAQFALDRPRDPFDFFRFRFHSTFGMIPFGCDTPGKREIVIQQQQIGSKFENEIKGNQSRIEKKTNQLLVYW